jgi:hypothetical protein
VRDADARGLSLKSLMPPLSNVNAPVEIVSSLLTCPGEMRAISLMCEYIGCTRLCPRGRTSSIRREFRFTIDAANYELGLDVKSPFGITVREDLHCARSPSDVIDTASTVTVISTSRRHGVTSSHAFSRVEKSSRVPLIPFPACDARRRYGASTRNSMIRGSIQ